MIKSRDLDSVPFRNTSQGGPLKLTLHINDNIRAMNTYCKVNWLSGK